MLAFPALPVELENLADRRWLLELNAVFVRACATEVRHRYRSAEEMQADLALLQSGRSVKRFRTMERRLAQVTRLGAVAALLLALALGAYLFSERQRRIVRESFERAEGQRHRAERAEQLAREKADATEQLWNAYLAQLQAGHLGGQRRERLETLRALAQAAAVRASPQLRNEAIATLALTDLRQIQTITPKGRVPEWLAFDPSLERSVALDKNVLRLFRAAEVAVRTNAVELARLTNVVTGTVTALRWSRDGRYAAIILRDHRFQVLDLEAAQPRFEEAAHADARLWAFTPDSRELVVAYADGRLVFRQAPTGQTNRVLQGEPLPRGLAFRPDGRALALFREGTNRVEIRAADTGLVVQSFDSPTRVEDVDWSPDGVRLATAGYDQGIYVWEAATGRLEQTLRGHASVVTRAKFLANENLLTSSGWDGTLRLWDPRSGRQLLNAPGLAFDFEFNPATGRLGFQTADGAHVAPFRPSRLVLFELVRSEVTRDLLEPSDPIRAGPWGVAFSPDERWLVSGSSDGLRFWHASTGRELAHLPGALTTSVFFGARGESLVACQRNQVVEWPITQPAADEIVLGPARVLAPLEPDRPFAEASRAPNGELFASVSGGRIRGFRHGTNFVHLNSSDNLTRLATSADGRWLAAGHAKVSNVGLFRIEDGKFIRGFPTAGPAIVAFTPDSRWLVTAALEDYCFWNVETRARGLRIGREQDPGLSGRMAFSNDGRMMAITRSQWVVSIVDPADGRELGRLEHPNPQLVSALAFSASGTLLAVATHAHLIQLWDLRRLRERLSAMKLDWDLPPFPSPAAPPAGTPAPLRVRLPQP